LYDAVEQYHPDEPVQSHWELHLQTVKTAAIHLALMTLGCLATLGAPLHVHVVKRSPVVDASIAHLLVRPAEAQTEANAARSAVETGLPGDVSIDVDPGLYLVTVTDERLWAPLQAVAVPMGGASATLIVFRRSTLHGTFKPTTNTVARPKEVHVRFRPLDDAGALESGARGESPCSLTGWRWTCTVPATTLDVSIKAIGYLGRFWWGLDASADRDLGSIALRRGAAVVGRVVVPRPYRSKIAEVSVTLRPQTAAPGLGRDSRRATLAHSIHPDGRGNFHFDGIPQGAYLLTATLATLAARAQPLRVIADAEADLRAPLILEEPQTVDFIVSPPRDHWDRPWVLQLQRKSEIGGVVVTERQARLDERGTWRVTNLPGGDYLISVRTVTGDAWLTRELSVPLDGDAVSLDVAPILLSGTVSLGQKPLRAKIWIGGEGHQLSIRTASAPDGKFAAYVPRSRKEEIGLVTIASELPKVLAHVRVTPDQLNEEEMRLTIELPATQIGGEVVDTDGNHVSRAVVNVSPDDGAVVQVPVQEDGSFHVYGISRGHIDLAAVAEGGRQSDRVAVNLEADATPEEFVRLVVRPARVLKGQVVSQTGPVPGAVVHAFPLPAGAFISPRISTDVDGRFTQPLPPSCSVADVIVFAPGFALRFFRQMVTDEEVPVMVSQITSQLRLAIRRTDAEHHRWPDLGHGGATRSLAMFLNFGARVDQSRGDIWTVEVPDVEPGQYTFCTPDSAQCVSVTAPPFGLAEVTAFR
jgi:hypothetical protein